MESTFDARAASDGEKQESSDLLTTEEEQDISSAARQLRIALDELFEHEFQFIDNPEEKLERFVLLVSQYSPKVAQQTVLLTNDDSHRLPLHLACDKNAPIEVIRWLIENDKEKHSLLTPDQWGDLPLHTICSRQNVEVTKLLLDSDGSKASLLTKDKHGSLPLHMACRYQAPPELIQLLLDNDARKTSLLEEGLYGQLPLHVACRCNAPLEVITLLLDNDATGKSPLLQDNVERLPIHLTLLRNPNIQVVKLLLEGMLYHRMETRGLELWKVDVYNMLGALKTPERDFIVKDKLDCIAKALRDFVERVFLLELALWRASCLGFNHSTAEIEFQTMQDIEQKSQVNPTFNADDYKQEAHVKSGADIIVPAVMSFLEDEPVAKIITEIE